MARTPEQWLDYLANKLDAQQVRVAELRRFTNGDAPLPEMGRNLRASWERFQSEARTNWGGLVVKAMADRIVYNGVTVGGSTSTPEAAAAQLVVRDNRLRVAFADAIRDALSVGHGFLLVQDGPIITREFPEMLVVERDERQPWRVVAALKVWRDSEGVDFAFMWLPGTRFEYMRDSAQSGMFRRSNRDGWTLTGSTSYTGVLPVFELANVDDLGEIEPHKDLIKRINRGVLWRLVTMSMQAFSQRGIKTEIGSPGLPEKDSNGNVIDYGQVFEPAPGALWELPEGISIWESQQTDIRPMLDAAKEDIKALCAVTNTPVWMLLPDSGNQSAQGAMETAGGLTSKARGFIERATPVLEGVLLSALRIQGFADVATVEVRFEPPDRVTLAEKMDAASKAVAAGMSLKTVQRDILGWSEDQIAADESERRRAAVQSMMASLPAKVPAA